MALVFLVASLAHSFIFWFLLAINKLGPILTWRLPFWGKSVTDIVFEIWDYARSYLQMAMEILRNMRLLLTSSMGMFGREDVDVATRDTSRSNNGKNKRRRIFHEASSMPGLEEDPAVTITIAQQKGQSHSDAKLSGAPAAGGGNDDETTLPVKATRVNRDNIEPAFLKDEDYPPGWLVYHPVLGVVPKTEADQYMK